jgi:hypothetical protein
MDIDRRRVLVGAAWSALTTAVGGSDFRPALTEPGVFGLDEWHPLTRSLLERARWIGRGGDAPDRTAIERTIRQFADRTGLPRPLVIKWIDTPSDAFDHLSRFGLDALLDMGTTGFWRRAQPPVPRDEETFDRAFEVRMVASSLLGVDAHDRTLMAPKLLPKSQAMSPNRSDQEVFRIRAVSSQIGWLETSMTEAAAQAISNVELLLSTRASEDSVAIDNQLRIFGSHEDGLLATWETPDALISVPKFRI